MCRLLSAIVAVTLVFNSVNLPEAKAGGGFGLSLGLGGGGGSFFRQGFRQNFRRNNVVFLGGGGCGSGLGLGYSLGLGSHCGGGLGLSYGYSQAFCAPPVVLAPPPVYTGGAAYYSAGYSGYGGGYAPPSGPIYGGYPPAPAQSQSYIDFTAFDERYVTKREFADFAEDVYDKIDRLRQAQRDNGPPPRPSDDDADY